MRPSVLSLFVVLSLFFAVGLAQKYYGVNQAAYVWAAHDPTRIPGRLWTDYPLINNASVDYFADNGFNTIRLPITWERLQPVLNGGFNLTYLGYIVTFIPHSIQHSLISGTVHHITKVRGMYCVLDIHNYNRYRGHLVDTPEVPLSSLRGMWKKLATVFKDNPLMIWGTMNEPHSTTYLNAQKAANAAIAGIREAGATQLITICGNDYSGVQSWTRNNYLWMGPSNITDPLNNWVYEMHQYFDTQQQGLYACDPVKNNVITMFRTTTAWARTNGVKIFLGEFGINDSDQCMPMLLSLMDYLKANSDVWIGWTWWSAGPWWAQDYIYAVEPLAGGVHRNRLVPTLKQYIPAAVPSPTSSPSKAASPSTSRAPASPSASISRTPATPSPSPSRAPASPSPSASRPPASPSRTPAPANGRPKYYGVTQPGLVWAPTSLPGKAGTNFPLVSNASINYFAAKGMNTIRVAILWERIQPTLNDQLDPIYAGYVRDTVNYITDAKGMYCVIDLHNFHRYRGHLVGSLDVPTCALFNVWHQIARMFKNNPRVIFGTMNQPHGVSPQAALESANAAISGIRSSGATQPITISGSDYSAVNAWVGSNSKWMGPANITDPLNNWMYDMQQFFDGQGGVTVCQPSVDVEALFGKVTQWARSLGAKVFLSAFAINDSDECLPLLNRLMTYLTANGDVWTGWAWWAAGQWWGQNFIYLIEPNADGTDRNRLMATLQNYFP